LSRRIGKNNVDKEYKIINKKAGKSGVHGVGDMELNARHPG
jgi:hypothetical protein